MEKTGAERVKYSLACQHEDAIPIKFVPYAQKCPTVLCTFAVALRKESVDRNCFSPLCSSSRAVALRKESVDRNAYARRITRKITLSLSARRAWIEISFTPNLRLQIGSLSARRAWIEMLNFWTIAMMSIVALRKESVDRNMLYNTSSLMKCQGRSPQGERG